MESVESVMIKVELEICHGCLSSDRRLIALSENTDLYLCLLGRYDVEGPTSISLCWECSAILRNTRRFQQRIQMAQDIMQQSLNQEERFCLSTLAINKTITYCNTDIQSILNNQNHEINTRCEGIFHQDILKKQAAVKLETIETKYENEFYQEMYIDNVDMESVVREKEECHINVYISTCSPSSTRDSSITVDPLEKKPKLHNVNEIKTEEKNEVTNTECVEETATEVQGRPNELFSCNVCGKEYTTEDYLNVHYRTHRAVGVFQCDICKKELSSKRNIRNHLRTHTGEKPLACELCHKRFTKRAHLEIHLRTHTGEKPYTCKMCDKKFNQQSSLEKHLRIHTGEKPYSCEICGMRFNRQESLKRHLRTHTGDKPYSCEMCDKRFIQHENLKRHLRTHTGEKPYSCKVCDKRFNQQKSLKRHLRTHTGDKPYSCEICGKRFNQNQYLKKHFRTHTGDKPYSCEICDKRFNRQDYLKQHLRTHTGDKPYSCAICNKRFNQNGNLKIHLRTHNNTN